MRWRAKKTSRRSRRPQRLQSSDPNSHPHSHTLTFALIRILTLTPNQAVKEIAQAVGDRVRELQQLLHVAKEQAGYTYYDSTYCDSPYYCTL